MRPSYVAVLTLVLAACASGGSSTGAAPQVDQTTRVEGVAGATEFRTTRSDPTNQYAVAATADRLWEVLPAVYAQLKVPVTVQLQAERSIGNRAFEVRRQLGGVWLSRYLSCGERLGKPNADSYQLTLRIETQVLPGTDDGSRLMTIVDGTAKPMAGAGGAVVCSSTGQLEKRMLEMVTEQLKRG